MKRLWLGLCAATALAGGAVAGEVSHTPARPAGTVISGAANGVGNKISVSGTSGTTVIQGSRLGVGNSIKVENHGSCVLVDDCGVTVNGVTVAPAAKKFWTKKVWSKEHGEYLYWSAKARAWYRYDRTDRAYYPLEVCPDE